MMATGVMVKGSFQDQLDSASVGAVIDLHGGEYGGPFVLRNPVTLRGVGQGATFSATPGPAIIVDSPGVTLENLIIETSNPAAPGSAGCAIQVNSGHRFQARDLLVRGKVAGVAGEEGDWQYPDSFPLGQIVTVAGAPTQRQMQITVPVPCTIVSKIDGLEVTPAQLAPGTQTVLLRMEPCGGRLILGDLHLVTPLVYRRIQVIGNVLNPVEQPQYQYPTGPVVAPRPTSPPVPVAHPPAPAVVPPPARKSPVAAPVSPVRAPVSPVKTPPPVLRPPVKPAKSSKKWVWIIGLAAALGGGAFYFAGGGYDPKALTSLSRLSAGGDAVTAVAVSPDDKLVALSAADNSVRVFQTATGQLNWRVARHDGTVRAIAFSGDGARVASAGDDIKIVLSKTATGEVDKVLRGHNDAVLALAFSPDGTRLAAGLKDRSVRIWDAASGELKRTYTRHDGPVQAIAFSSDGNTFVTGGDDNKIIVWDAASGESKLILRGHNDGVRAVAISRDGNSVAAGFQDGTVRVWEGSNPMPKRTLRGHNAPVRSVMFSRNGATVVSLSGDASLVLWNTSDGELKRTLRGYGTAADAAALSPSGLVMAAGGKGGAVQVWKCE
jgi:hypothetical protein